MRMVPSYNRGYGNHFIVLHHRTISQHSHNLVISRPITLFWQRLNQFLRWTTLYMTSIWQGSFNYQFEIFGLNRSGIESAPPRHGVNALTTGLPRWFRFDINKLITFYDASFKIERKIVLWALRKNNIFS